MSSETVWIEVVPRLKGLAWAVTVNGTQVTAVLTHQSDADRIARLIGNAVAVGRAELVLKDRRGRIRPGGQGKDSFGRDPRKTRG